MLIAVFLVMFLDNVGIWSVISKCWFYECQSLWCFWIWYVCICHQKFLPVLVLLFFSVSKRTNYMIAIAVNNREIRMIWCSRHSGVTSEAQGGRHVSDCNAQAKICWIMPEEVACRSLRHCRRGWWCSKIWILPRFFVFFPEVLKARSKIDLGMAQQIQKLMGQDSHQLIANS